MSLARLVVTAIYVEWRSSWEVAREQRVSRRWVQKLAARYDAEGEAAFEPRSRRPHTSPQRIWPEPEAEIVMLRKSLAEEGLDGGRPRSRSTWRSGTAAHRRSPRSGGC
jgi:hypothetical protein